MSNIKISQLPSASTPLTGAELVPVVQSGTTAQTTVAEFISGQIVNAALLVTGLTADSSAAATANVTAITAAGLRMYNAGGGTVVIPAGTYYINSSIPLYKGVIYKGTSASADIVLTATAYGTIIKGTTNTFAGFAYNASDLASPLASQNLFIGGMVYGAGIDTICISDCAYGVRVGGLYNPGSECGIWRNIYALRCGWGFWFENCQADQYTQLQTVSHTSGAGMFASTSGGFGGVSGNYWNCGNSVATQLFSQQGGVASSIKVRGWVFSTNPNGNATGQSSLNDITVLGIQSNRYETSFEQTPSGNMFDGTTTSIKVTDSSAFAVGMPIVFTSSTPSNFMQYKPYFVKSIVDSTHITVSDYVYGTAIIGNTAMGGTIATWGFPHIEFVGLSPTSYIQPCSLKGIDIEGNATIGILFQYATGVSVEAGGYVYMGEQYPYDYPNGGTAKTVSNSNYVVTAAYRYANMCTIQNWPSEVSYTLDYSCNGNTVIGGYLAPKPAPEAAVGGNGLNPVGYSVLNNNNSGNTRLQSKSGVVTLTTYGGPNIGYNGNSNATEFSNGAIAFPTTVKSSGQTLPSPAVGSGSSSIVYTGAGGGNVTLPTIPTNGEGQFFVVSNPSSGTLTINTSSSQTIKGVGTSGTSITIAANTNVVLLSQYDGTTKFWARV